MASAAEAPTAVTRSAAFLDAVTARIANTALADDDTETISGWRTGSSNRSSDGSFVVTVTFCGRSR